MDSSAANSGQLLLELTRFGAAIRVVAIDEVSRCEVRFTAPVGTPFEAIEALAARKIAYVLKRAELPLRTGYA